jgi:hypothetical protein
MPHLVSLAELLADTGVDNGATPLFDKDSLSVEAGPTAQQVVIHAGSGAAVRKHVAELNPTHPEVTYPAPKKGEPGDVNTDYPLPSPQALAAAASSEGGVPEGRPAGLPAGVTLTRPDPPKAVSSATSGSSKSKGSSRTPSQSPDSSSSATYTATSHSDTPAAATSEPGSAAAVTKTHEGLQSSGVSPGEGPAQATTAAKTERKQQTAEAAPTGRAESKTGRPDAAKAPKK